MPDAASLRKVISRFGGPAVIVDVSARDGLQVHPSVLSPRRRAFWVRALLAAGVPEVEAGSFVSPESVPQMEGTAETLSLLGDVAAALWVLVPNRRGLERALAAGARNLVLLASATEAHSAANLGRSVRAVLDRLPEVAAAAREAGARVRLAISAAWGDPAEGRTPTAEAVRICSEASAAGVPEVTLCDTYGGASPTAVAEVLEAVLAVYPSAALGLHLHDAFGCAAASAFVGLCLGVRRFDASIGGLGGCPAIPGAHGNLATEDLNHLLQSLGFETGIDEARLRRAVRECLRGLERKDPREERPECPNPW